MSANNSPLNTSIFLSQIWKLQAALSEQTEITKFSQQEYERLQNVMFQLRLLIFSITNNENFNIVFINVTSLTCFCRIPQEKILCRVCFEEQINVVLLPCRHHVLCRYLLHVPIHTLAAHYLPAYTIYVDLIHRIRYS